MLADMLGQSFKEYVTRIAEITRSNALKAMDGDRSKLQIELDSLRSERKQLEAKRDEQKSQLLSEQRQRRALNDRVSESDEPKQKRRRGRPKKDTSAARQSRQDSSDGLDDIDWLLPGGAPASAAHHPSSDPDFGYQPPQRPSFPVSDAQLTLF